jgi:hypothetical protein
VKAWLIVVERRGVDERYILPNLHLVGERSNVRVLHTPKESTSSPPSNWAQSRARLDATQLAHEFGPLTIPRRPKRRPRRTARAEEYGSGVMPRSCAPSAWARETGFTIGYSGVAIAGGNGGGDVRERATKRGRETHCAQLGRCAP